MATKRRATAVRKRQIVDAARKMIIKYGSEHVTVRKIARQVGISEAAVYRHFQSKRDILSVLVEDIDQMWEKEIKESEASETVERLNKLLSNRVSTAEQRGGVSFQVLAEIISLGDKSLNRQASHVVESYIEHISGIIADGISKGEFKKDLDAKATAFIFYSLIQGLVFTWNLSNSGFKLNARYDPCWNVLHDAFVTDKTKNRMKRNE